MKIMTWNVNSILTLRQYYPWSQMKSFNDILNTLQADILCFQEMKISKEKLEKDVALPKDYDSYFSFCTTRKGYSGVCTYVKKTILVVEAFNGFIDAFKDLDCEFSSEELRELDEEGRVVITDHKEFVLVNVYCPNETSEDRRAFKMKFHKVLQSYAEQLISQGRSVVIAGDVNVAKEEIDHCDPKKSCKVYNLEKFCDHPARMWMNEFLGKGQVIDLFRHYYPERIGAYTCWDTLLNARPANYGTRIDYILVSKGLLNNCESVEIEDKVMGSDHCPVSCVLNISQIVSPASNYKPPSLCSCYFDKFCSKQKTIHSFFKPIQKEKRQDREEESKYEIEEIVKDSTLLTSPPKTKLSGNWAQIFQAQPPPKCKHDETCKEMTVNKAGPNKGRKFYMCARPIGSNTKEFRCDFFQWKHESSNKKKRKD